MDLARLCSLQQRTMDIVAVGGLNVDPYTSDHSIGRVRHVYVSRSARRRGVGKLLVLEIIEAARDSFRQLRLRTNTDEGDRFYRALGFQRDSVSSESTHYNATGVT